MIQFPQRSSLISQTAEILRDQIGAGEWRNALPGERELAARLHVSRPTLRSALELLRREGWLEVAQGRCRRILHKAVQRHAILTKRVGLLSPVPMHRMAPFVIFWIDCLRKRLGEVGYELDVHASPALGSCNPERALERLIGMTPSAAWVLLLSTERVQRWFADRQLPCVITGSCFGGIDLPSVDIDLRAACRHAAGLFLSKGHRRMILLLPDTRLAGDLASETGFLEGTTALQNTEQGFAQVLRHDESVADIICKIEAATSGSNAATALLVARSVHALTALTYLQRRQLRIPQQIALVSRDSDAFFDFVTPQVARYSCDPAIFARRVSRLVVPLAQHGTVPNRPVLLVPELIRGETV